MRTVKYICDSTMEFPKGILNGKWKLLQKQLQKQQTLPVNTGEGVCVRVRVCPSVLACLLVWGGLAF